MFAEGGKNLLDHKIWFSAVSQTEGMSDIKLFLSFILAKGGYLSFVTTHILEF